MSKSGFSISAAFVSHALTGIAGLLALLAAQFVSPLIAGVGGGGLVLIGAFVAASFLRNRNRNGLALIENAVASGDKPPGNGEFHVAASNIVNHISRLATVASRGREQSREVEALLNAFDRRNREGADKPNASKQLTRLLVSLGNDSRASVSGLGAVQRELDLISQKVAEINDEQQELVREGAKEVDHLAQSIETVHTNAKEVGVGGAATDRIVDRVSSRLLDFQEQLDRLRELLSSCDKKSHFLRDQATEIAALLQSIVEHSAKTDTMALNASIESVRAGEHGRGFAAAADEIRKLTGVISESTQSVLERLKVVESSAGEASELCIDGQGTLDTQLTVARDVTQSMSEIRETNQKSREQLDNVLEKTAAQMDHVTAMAKVLDGLLGCVDRSVLQLEDGDGRRKAFRSRLLKLDQLLEPLAPNARSSAPTAALQGPPAKSSDTVDLESIDLAKIK